MEKLLNILIIHNIIIIKRNYFIFILSFIIQLRIAFCDSCKSNNIITNVECFNNIFIFSGKTYRAGSFAKNKEGDVIIEYSTGESRLFFGLKKNGEFYFSGENYIKEIESINNDGGITQRYESQNIFVSLEEDNNKDNEYLFSISSYESLSELHDLKNNSYAIKKTSSFLGHSIFSYIIPLLEIKSNNKNAYFFLFIHGSGIEGNQFSIKKIGFNSFSLNQYDNLKMITISNNNNNRILNSFTIDEDEILVVFFIKTGSKLVVSFYDFDLNEKGIDAEVISISNPYTGNGNFFKSLYLDNYFAAIIFFKDGNDDNSLNIEILTIIKGETHYSHERIFITNINKFTLKSLITLNDFVKINNERLAFVSTSEFTKLYILIFDLYNNYTNMKIRAYNYDLSPYKIVHELSAFVYNDYLIFSSTVTSSSSSLEFFSIFMIFGYANGTDNIIDISLCFTDINNYNSSNNIITKLLEGLKIDNNIFGYIPSKQIKLISIPSQILFYNGDETTLLTNGKILEFNHRFEQNKNLIKTDEYYSLDYQFIIKEPDYATFYNNANDVINYPSDYYGDQSSNFEQKFFYGKKNTAHFKLCHEYCASCKTIGNSNDDQQCLSCLSLYQYDYFNDYPSNCVPEGYYNDKQENKLVKCNNNNSKYYVNITNNKTICFKKEYDCPINYPYLNTSSNECQNYTPPTIIITTIPTTIITTIPTTIITTIPTTIITTIPTTIITTFPTTIITTFPTTILTTIPRATITTIPTTIPTTILTKIPTTILNSFYDLLTNKMESLCNYNNFINNNCSLENNNNTDIYIKIKNEIIKSYNDNKNQESIVIKGDENYVFHITNGENEKNSLNGNYDNKFNLSMVDLGECGDLLKKEYNINDEENLIILKFEKLTNIASEKNVQYEVYQPITLEKLNLSICSSNLIDLYIPIILSERTQNLYDDLKESGYDLFNENDSFYNDICTPYESENGTDVLLSDRKKDYYSANETTCQANCKFSEYSSESKYLKCECNVVSENIDTQEPEKFRGEMIYQSFYYAIKYSNFAVLKCYKLVFNFCYLKRNNGSIIVSIYFLFYIIFVIIYIFKGILPLKNEITNLISKKNENSQHNKINRIYSINNNSKSHKSKKKNLKTEINSKYKSSINLISKIKNRKKINRKSDIEILKKNNKTHSIDYKKIFFPVKKKKSTKKNYIIKKDLKKQDHKVKPYKKSFDKLENKSIISDKSNIIINKSNRKETEHLNKFLKKNKKSINFESTKYRLSKKKEQMSDFELNDLPYFEAIKLDKRSFCRMYWSLLRREHIILFTFFSWHDYNIIYVKLAKFFFLVCQDMAMNVIFFSDDSMHKIYADFGKYTFIQQIPQIIYSTTVSQLLEIFLCYLSLTDKNYYQIKVIKNIKINKNIVYKVLRCVKFKLFGFFSFTLILFAFYWYFVSSFCAVYHNTQSAFIKDSILSFLTGLLYPFILYLFPAILRILALKDTVKKRFKFIYKLSEVIPFF